MTNRLRLIKVCETSDLPPGSMKSIDLDGRKILIVNIEGKFNALEGICTHEWADLSMGFVSENIITCPLHLSQFDLSTGEALTPPATEALKLFNVKIEGSTVYVEVE